MTRSRDDAIRLCRPFLAAKYAAYHQWGQSQGVPEDDNDLGADFARSRAAERLLG